MDGFDGTKFNFAKSPTYNTKINKMKNRRRQNREQRKKTWMAFSEEKSSTLLCHKTFQQNSSYKSFKWTVLHSYILYINSIPIPTPPFHTLRFIRIRWSAVWNVIEMLTPFFHICGGHFVQYQIHPLILSPQVYTKICRYI